MGRRRRYRDYAPTPPEVLDAIAEELEFEEAEFWVTGEPEPEPQGWEYDEDEDGELPF